MTDTVDGLELIRRAEEALEFARARKYVKGALWTEDLEALVQLARSALVTHAAEARAQASGHPCTTSTQARLHYS